MPSGADAPALRPHQPVANAQCQRDRGEPNELSGAHFAQVEDDELARYRQQGDEQYDLRLNDALFALDHILQSVVELQGDQ